MPSRSCRSHAVGSGTSPARKPAFSLRSWYDDHASLSFATSSPAAARNRPLISARRSGSIAPARCPSVEGRGRSRPRSSRWTVDRATAARSASRRVLRPYSARNRRIRSPRAGTVPVVPGAYGARATSVQCPVTLAVPSCLV